MNNKYSYALIPIIPILCLLIYNNYNMSFENDFIELFITNIIIFISAPLTFIELCILLILMLVYTFIIVSIPIIVPTALVCIAYYYGYKICEYCFGYTCARAILAVITGITLLSIVSYIS
jgi:hypothetical protein